MRVYRPGKEGVSRRRFLASMGAIGALSLPGSAPTSWAANLPLVGEEHRSAIPVKNRAPLQPGVFSMLPLGSIRPAGWLREQLLIQARGLSGHLDETWADVRPESGWLGGSGESWERGPYYLDWLIPLAYLLNDASLKQKARRYVDWTLDHPSPEGMIGPRSNSDWWPRMVMAKALTQYQEATADPRVIPVLSRYFCLQLSSLPQKPLRDWGKYRWHDEALSVVWLYNRTGDFRLLDLFRTLVRQGFDWQAEFANFQFTQKTTPQSIDLKENSPLTDRGMQTHGVNVAMAIKMSPVRWLLTGEMADREGAAKMLKTLYEYHGLPNGIFSADEHLAGRNPSQGTELCAVVETIFSLEHALPSSAMPRWAIAWRRLRSMRFPERLPTICGRTSTNNSQTRSSLACKRSPGRRTGPSRTFTDLIQTLAAAQPISARDGRSSVQAFSCSLPTMVWRPSPMRRARFIPQCATRRRTFARRRITLSWVKFDLPCIPQRRLNFRCG